MSKPKTRRNKRIKELKKKGLSYYALGKMYGISPKTVWGIVKGYPKKKKTSK